MHLALVSLVWVAVGGVAIIMALAVLSALGSMVGEARSRRSMRLAERRAVDRVATARIAREDAAARLLR